MIGTAVTTLPWAFQQAGMGLGLFLAVVGFLVSYYTCMLVINVTGTLPDYADALRYHYGDVGYYLGIITPNVLCLGAVIVMFVAMA